MENIKDLRFKTVSENDKLLELTEVACRIATGEINSQPVGKLDFSGLEQTLNYAKTRLVNSITDATPAVKQLKVQSTKKAAART